MLVVTKRPTRKFLSINPKIRKKNLIKKNLQPLKRKRRKIKLRTRCAAAVYAIARMRTIDVIHAAVASQLSAG